MFRIVDKNGTDQCGQVTDEKAARETCDTMNRLHKDNEFNVIALPVVYGPAADRARAARAAQALAN